MLLSVPLYPRSGNRFGRLYQVLRVKVISVRYQKFWYTAIRPLFWFSLRMISVRKKTGGYAMYKTSRRIDLSFAKSIDGFAAYHFCERRDANERQ